MGSRISVRADEGEPFELGTTRSMRNDVIFHALEETPILAGNNVFYGSKVIVHGGGRDPIAGGGNNQETVIGNNVTLRDQAVVFRSRIADGETVGFKSAVVATDTALVAGTTIPDWQVYVNNAFFGNVEW